MNLRQLFLRHVAQTSSAPLAIEIVKAEGCILTEASGKEYIDLIGGISVANTGHRHPKIVEAIKHQADHYLHVMVYGEFVESPEVRYARLLTSMLPPSLDCVYFTNSGAEAVEGAMKLSKRVTNRTRIAAFESSYHGSTQGALSLIGSEYWRNAYRPLLPGIDHLRYNSFDDLKLITEETACVIAETIQAEAGIIAPDPEWIKALRDRCSETGCLLVLDEIQAGFGRTGRLWGFEHFDIVPDILLLGKALGGGLPLGAFVAGKNLMDHLTDHPVLGHITTFGGHPLSCAAGLAGLEVIIEQSLPLTVAKKAELIRNELKHPSIRALRSFGLWMAVEFADFDTCKKVIDRCIELGVLTDWFLFASNCLRISPPLTISEDELKKAMVILNQAMEECG